MESAAREKIYKILVVDLNKSLKHENGAELVALCLEEFTNKYIPQFTTLPIGEWTLRPDLLVEGKICLLAHCDDTKRALGVLHRDKSDLTSAIPDPFKFVFRRLVLKNRIKNGKVVSSKLIESNKAALLVVNEKRGFWFIHTPSNEPLGSIDDIDENMPVLLKVYHQVVEGMEKKIAPSIERKPEHIGREQLYLQLYPDEKWKKTMLEFHKKNNKRKNDSDDDEELPPPPPPPPPPLEFSTEYPVDAFVHIPGYYDKELDALDALCSMDKKKKKKPTYPHVKTPTIALSKIDFNNLIQEAENEIDKRLSANDEIESLDPDDLNKVMDEVMTET
jgi:hypothetical protein